MTKKPKPQILYTVKDGPVPSSYTISKLSEDFEVLASYTLSENGHSLFCNCPAHVPFCKHCKILRNFQAEKRVSLGWFFNYDAQTWTPPLVNPNQGSDTTS